MITLILIKHFFLNFLGQESGFQSCASLFSMNNNVQQNHPTFHQQQHPTYLDRLHPQQRSSLKDIYSGRKSQTLANGEDYSVVLNNYSDPFTLKGQPDNRVASSIYGSGRRSIHNVFKPNSSQNGSMTSLLSGLNSPLLGSSHLQNSKNRRISSNNNPAAMTDSSNNSESDGKLPYLGRQDRFSLDINQSMKPINNLIDGMAHAFNKTVDNSISKFSQQYLSPYLESNMSNSPSQGMLKPLFFEVPQRDVLKATISGFVGR